MTDNINSFYQNARQADMEYTRKYQQQEQDIQKKSVEADLEKIPLEMIGGGLTQTGLSGLKSKTGVLYQNLVKS